RIAPHCEIYYGTDFSKAAINQIQQVLDTSEAQYSAVRLSHREADDLIDLAQNEFECVVINSVVQYFPSLDYLLRVLERAVQLVASGGYIFVGDVRSLPLLEAFHLSVELERTRHEKISTDELQNRIQRQMAAENELVIDPRFFVGLPERLAGIRGVSI